MNRRPRILGMRGRQVCYLKPPPPPGRGRGSTLYWNRICVPLSGRILSATLPSSPPRRVRQFLLVSAAPAAETRASLRQRNLEMYETVFLSRNPRSMEGQMTYRNRSNSRVDESREAMNGKANAMTAETDCVHWCPHLGASNLGFEFLVAYGLENGKGGQP